MVGMIVGLFRLFLCFLAFLWLYFTEYIEYADALISVFIVRHYMLKWGLGSTPAWIAAIVITITFLILFKTTKSGWYVATALFSYAWAIVFAEFITYLFKANDIVYWIIIIGLTAYFVWLHRYALERKAAHERYHEQQYSKRHPNKVKTEKPLTEAELKDLEYKMNLAFSKKSPLRKNQKS